MSATFAFPEEERVEIGRARWIADELVELFSPVCERIEIKGSICRGRAFVKDAELVLIPKMVPITAGLFDETVSEESAQLLLVRDLIERGEISLRVGEKGGTTCGAGTQFLVYKNLKVDVFGVLGDSQWGVIATIRTGSADFIRRILTPDCKHGTVLPPGMYCRGGRLWKDGKLVDDPKDSRGLPKYDFGEPLLTPEEKDLFTVIGLDWVAPGERTA